MSINFQIMGAGSPLIIIHGLFGTSDNLKSVARQLSDEYCVYLIDAPAHGDSPTCSPLTIATMAEQVVQFINDNNLSGCSLLGHSLGGKIAMEVALMHPALISKLIVADIAPVQYTRRHDDIIKGLQSIPLDNLDNRQQADSILKDYIPEAGVRSFLLKSLIKKVKNQSEWEWRFDLNGLAKNYDQLIAPNRDGSYTSPTMFVIGSESNYVKETYRNDIVSRFPNVKSKVIHGAGHWLHAERPVAFVKICRDFLNQ
jgi:esterase